MPEALPTIILLGAGHAHLGVIDDWLKRGAPAARTLLVEPRARMHYSGMVPGWIAGEYRRGGATIALAPVVEAAGIVWHREPATALDPAARTVTLASGAVLAFDLCSIATGGEARAQHVLGEDPRLLDIRPIDRFMTRWTELRGAPDPPRSIAVVGAGAGGVELAFGLRNSAHAPRVTLVTGRQGVLPDHGGSVRRMVIRELAAQSIGLRASDARIEDGELVTDSGQKERPDLIVAALGSGAPAWPRASGLPVDAEGFIRVGPAQQVEGFPHILAAGDAARRTDRTVPHSGVHAVYAGPVLAKNLRALVAGRGRLSVYDPRGMDFYLLNTCRGEAILSYGRIALKGGWLRRLKDWLDRRWIRRFTGRGGPR